MLVGSPCLLDGEASATLARYASFEVTLASIFQPSRSAAASAKDRIKGDRINGDRIKGDGIKGDGIKDDGIKDDGIKDDGIKDDGFCSTLWKWSGNAG
ncbi:hypothetical protein [Novipirellula rosea]|uniref:hypothetical protein n=1 Tax=Novipirellula rosea TaxID=1031540 RepID=UPI0031E9119B